MNLQRLKFAWARGARIQCTELQPQYGWEVVENPMWSIAVKYRIHPDDEHLAYGPLSSALRDAAISDVPDEPATIYERAAEPFYSRAFYEAGLTWAPAPAIEDRRLLLLFVAELLADEGL